MKIYPTETNKEFRSETDYCYGMDLGTTYSLLARVDFKDVNFELSNRIPVNFIKIKQASPYPLDPVIEDEKVASIIAMSNGKIHVGNNLYHLKGHVDFKYRENIFYDWKREMGVEGSPIYSSAIEKRLDMPFKVAGLIMKYMQAMHLKSKDKTLQNTVITVPASFQANQRKDTIKAAKVAGIKLSNRMLIDEPNAAFLGYFNRLTEDMKQTFVKNCKDKNVLIIDFGGGTLDLSILNIRFKLDDGILIENKSISRYNDLGGNDLDLLLTEDLLFPLLVSKHNIFESLSIHEIQKNIIPQLAVMAENLKKGICEKISLKAVDEDARTFQLGKINFELKNCTVNYKESIYRLDSIVIDAAKFDLIFRKMFRGEKYDFKLSDRRVTTISKSITDVVEKSGLDFDDISNVLYVGGSSFNPLLKSYVDEKLINSRPLLTHEPDKLVAEGAAIYSYFYHAHGKTLIPPITSDTIGIQASGGRFSPIIERSQSLPVSVSLPDFELQADSQKELVVPICIKSVDFPIGEIRCDLKKSYPIKTKVQIKATINQDKLFDISIYIENEFISSAQIDNPYSIGMLGKEQMAIIDLKSKISQSKKDDAKNVEREYLRELIGKHSDVDNYIGVVESAEEYIRRFDDQDSYVWNMSHIGNKLIGRVKVAVNSLKKALEISPENPGYIFNYSLILEETSSIHALEFLESHSKSIKEDPTIKLKMFLLNHGLNKISKTLAEQSRNQAKAIVKEYKTSPFLFSKFDKECLLPKVFKIADEAFSYVPPSIPEGMTDENSFLNIKTQEAKD